MKQSNQIIFGLIILLVSFNQATSVKLNTKFFSWFFLGRDESTIANNKTEIIPQANIEKSTLDVSTKDLAIEKTVVPLPNIDKENKPLEKDAKVELKIVKTDENKEIAKEIIQKGEHNLRTKTEKLINIEENKPKSTKTLTDISKPEKVEKLGKMKTEKIEVEPIISNKVEIIKEEIESNNGKTLKKTISEKDDSVDQEVQQEEDHYTKTEKCIDYNNYNCDVICGTNKMNNCEQTTNFFPEQMFRCLCAGKVTPWYYNDGTDNIICPEQNLNLASVVLQKRRVAIDVINRMNEKDITLLVNNLQLDKDERLNVEEADKREKYFKLHKMGEQKLQDKENLEAVKQAKDQKEAETVLNNIDKYINDPSTYGNKDNLDENQFNLNCPTFNESRQC